MAHESTDLAAMVESILTAGTPRYVRHQAVKQAPRRFAADPVPLTGFDTLDALEGERDDEDKPRDYDDQWEREPIAPYPCQVTEWRRR